MNIPRPGNERFLDLHKFGGLVMYLTMKQLVAADMDLPFLYSVTWVLIHQRYCMRMRVGNLCSSECTHCLEIIKAAAHDVDWTRVKRPGARLTCLLSHAVASQAEAATAARVANVRSCPLPVAGGGESALERVVREIALERERRSRPDSAM